jgi:hypothetical protein
MKKLAKRRCCFALTGCWSRSDRTQRLERSVIYSEYGTLGLVWLEIGHRTVFVTGHDLR